MATPIPKNQAELTVGEILDATAGELIAGSVSDRIRGVATDTRGIEPGTAFVALRGRAHDGHAYVGEAAAAGARLAIVERVVDAPASLAILRVDSTLRALGDIARAHVRRWRASDTRTLIAITGSAGKTTTRMATTAILNCLFPGEVAASVGNLNNRVGLPMVLLALGPAHRIAVVEMGTSERGEIGELCRIAEPDVGVVTLVAAAHLEGLGSIDDVADEKAALFRAVAPKGIAIGNGDDERVCRELTKSCAVRRVTYGCSSTADVRVVERTPTGVMAARLVLAHADGRRSEIETRLLGTAGAMACAAALATTEAAFQVQLDGTLLTRALNAADGSAGAGRLAPRLLPDGLAILDNTYNANPASMVSSIRAAAEIARVTRRRLVLVLGEMRELGAESACGHREVAPRLRSIAEVVVVVGPGEAAQIADGARLGGAGVWLVAAGSYHCSHRKRCPLVRSGSGQGLPCPRDRSASLRNLNGYMGTIGARRRDLQVFIR